MARKDLLKIAEWLSSSKDEYFNKGVRTVKEVLPPAIRSHDRATAVALTDELVGTFWYWDKRVIHVKDWNRVQGDLTAFVAMREKARGRRDTVRGLIRDVRDVARRLRETQGGKRGEGLSHHILQTVEHYETQWELIASRRIADDEAAAEIARSP